MSAALARSFVSRHDRLKAIREDINKQWEEMNSKPVKSLESSPSGTPLNHAPSASPAVSPSHSSAIVNAMMNPKKPSFLKEVENMCKYFEYLTKAEQCDVVPVDIPNLIDFVRNSLNSEIDPPS